jgi:hypothetical protein
VLTHFAAAELGRSAAESLQMDDAKCRALKAELANHSEPQVVPIDRFFDGNDDLGSIGCNLVPHPGIPTFQRVLTGLLVRTDVEAVYAQISELDPGEGCWPFTDTVLVVGSAPADDLRAAMGELQPDEVGAAERFGVPQFIAARHRSPVTVIWWD